MDTAQLEAAEPTPPQRSLAGDAAYMAISQAVNIGGTFLIGVFVSRALGPSGKGIVTLLQQVPFFGFMALNLGLATANSYFVGRKLRTPGQAFSDSLAMVTVTSIIGVPVLVLAMTLFFPPLAGLPTALKLAAALMLPASLLNAYAVAIAVGIHKVRFIAIAQVVASLLTLAVVGAAYFMHSLTVAIVVVTQIVALAGTIVALAFAMRCAGARLFVAPSYHRLREQASFAGRAFLTELTNYVSLRADVLLLGALSTATAVGVYSVGVAFTELLWFLPNSVGQALLSRSMRAEQTEGAQTAATLTRIVVTLMLGLGVVIAILVRPLVSWLYGPQFAPAAEVFWILAPGVVMLGAGRTITSYLTAHGRLLPGVALTATSANVVLNILVIPRWGYLGAAAVSTLTYSVAAVLIIRAFKQMTGIPFRKVLLPTARLPLRRGGRG